MFVRKNRNRSGSISVQIVSKEHGKYRVETVGSAKDAEEIEKLVVEAKNRINYPADQIPLFSVLSKTDVAIKSFLENMTNLQVRTIGPELIFGTLFDRIGYGYPIGYDIFEGNVFEGHTLLPTLENVQKKYGFNKPVVVADAALLSRKNLENLANEKYQFIIGGRIKNENDEVKQAILRQAKNMKDGEGLSFKKPDGTRLVVTYSDKRQKKDFHNRERGLLKLRQKVKSGRLTKESINNRGYNKFLAIKGDVRVEIDEEKVKEDQLWDGLKGYITNTRLLHKSIVENYRHLWQIEKAFRISKTDLKIRPVHHYRKKRIEAHICIAFVAYTIYKEMERLLYKHNAGFSPKRAAELTHNMYELEYVLPHSKKKEKTILKRDKEQELLYKIVHA